MVTPGSPIAEGETITVRVDYTGRPGVHTDGDGSTEGWFRVNTAAAPNDGSFVTTEPVGNMAWMPLNNHPTAKPTYDIYDTVPSARRRFGPASSSGATLGPHVRPARPTAVNPPDANFPGGSWTWHWHAPSAIPSYLVTNTIGSYDLLARTSAITGIEYYQAQASGLTAARKATIKAVLDTQEDITKFQTLFNGPLPFSTNGVIVGLPSVGFEEEMQTKITFGERRRRSTPSVGTFHHENMHQWFGDNVSEVSFSMTFWKEGWATVGEYLNIARTAANTAGGLGTPAGNAAFDDEPGRAVQHELRDDGHHFWTSRRRTRPSATSSRRRARTRGRARRTSRCGRSSTLPGPAGLRPLDRRMRQILRSTAAARSRGRSSSRSSTSGCRIRAPGATPSSTSSSRSGSTLPTRAERRANKPQITARADGPAILQRRRDVHPRRADDRFAPLAGRSPGDAGLHVTATRTRASR